MSFFRYADYVLVGDEVLTAHNNDKLAPVKVINVYNLNMQGTFLSLIFCFFLLQHIIFWAQSKKYMINLRTNLSNLNLVV